MSDVIGQALTLAVLFLAFVLVESSSSYGRARAAVGTEADVLDTLDEAASFAPEPQREAIRADLICYARAVVGHEWPSMADGARSQAADVWADRLLVPIRQLYHARELIFEQLIQDDAHRSQARSQRLAEALPTTPSVVYWLVVLTLAISLAGFAFSLPRQRNRAHVVTLAVVAGLLLATVVLIRDLDLPFSGLARISPAPIASTGDALTASYLADYPTGQLPCDQTGRLAGS